MSLRSRLIGAIAALLAAVLVIGSILTYGQAQRRVQVEMDAAMDVARNTLARAVREAPQPIQRASLLVAVRVFDGDRHIRAELIDATGRVEAVSSVRGPANPVPEWFVRVMAPDYADDQVVVSPVSQGGWSIRLVPDPRSEVDEVWSDMLLSLAVLLVFCASAFLVVFMVIGRALAPIASLAEGFRAIGEGSYGHRLQQVGSPELAKLCAGYNEMAGRLEQMAARNRQLSDQLIRLQDEERADLARDLHDEVGPFLFAIDVDASEIERVAGETTPPVPPTFSERAASIRQAAAHARKHVRSILGQLRPGIAGSLGLAAAIHEIVDFLRERHPAITFEVDLPDRGFGATVDGVILAVIREAVNNAVRHGKPSRLEVSVVEMDNEVAFSVIDDGQGFGSTPGNAGYGLIGMRERVAAAGGTISIGNRGYGRGAAVSVVLPVAEADEGLKGVLREGAMA